MGFSETEGTVGGRDVYVLAAGDISVLFVEDALAAWEHHVAGSSKGHGSYHTGSSISSKQRSSCPGWTVPWRDFGDTVAERWLADPEAAVVGVDGL